MNIQVTWREREGGGEGGGMWKKDSVGGMFVVASGACFSTSGCFSRLPVRLPHHSKCLFIFFKVISGHPKTVSTLNG